MIIIKRNGSHQNFDSSKIKDSISNTANNNNTPLQQSETNSIVNDIISQVYHKYSVEIKYSEVRGLIVEELKRRGFTDIAEAYESGSLLPKKIKPTENVKL